jgi:hypothetical protein
MKPSKPGLVLALSYLAIFALAEAFAFHRLVFHTATSEFSGLFALLATMPWSMIRVPLADSLGYIAWYDRFAGNFAVLGLLPGAILNAVILYFVDRAFAAARRHEAWS